MKPSYEVLCKGCGKQMTVNTRVKKFCDECKANKTLANLRNWENLKVIREGRKESGLCIICGNIRAKGSPQYCEEHKVIVAQGQAFHREKRKKAFDICKQLEEMGILDGNWDLVINDRIGKGRK